MGKPKETEPKRKDKRKEVPEWLDDQCDEEHGQRDEVPSPQRTEKKNGEQSTYLIKLPEPYSNMTFKKSWNGLWSGLFSKEYSETFEFRAWYKRNTSKKGCLKIVCASLDQKCPSTIADLEGLLKKAYTSVISKDVPEYSNQWFTGTNGQGEMVWFFNFNLQPDEPKTREIGFMCSPKIAPPEGSNFEFRKANAPVKCGIEQIVKRFERTDCDHLVSVTLQFWGVSENTWQKDFAEKKVLKIPVSVKRLVIKESVPKKNEFEDLEPIVIDRD